MVVSDRDKSQTVINLSGGLIQDNNSEGPGGGISLGYLQASNGQNILNITIYNKIYLTKDSFADQRS